MRLKKCVPFPPPGVEVPAGDKTELAAGVAQLAKEIAELSNALKGKPALLELISDVAVYHKAVHDALEYNEFHNVKEVDIARKLLKQGQERAAVLREGKSPWTTATGLVGARLRLEDRRLGAALWPGRAGLVSGRSAASTTGSTSGATAAAKR